MQSGVINSRPELFEQDGDFIYALLGRFPAALCLDVGAASGAVAKKIVKASPASRVICYEPLRGNWRFFEKRIGGHPNVTLVRAAVGAKAREDGELYVSRVNDGSEPGWRGMAGYSSSGRLVRNRADRQGLAEDKMQPTPVCTIDGTVSEHVRLMKIDVQGGEIDVLRGAEHTIATHGIDMMYVEFTGSKAVLNFLADHGYLILEDIFVSIKSDAEPPFRPLGPSQLSTGRKMAKGWPVGQPRDFAGYCRFMGDYHRAHGSLWTDLVCVHAKFLPQFLAATE